MFAFVCACRLASELIACKLHVHALMLTSASGSVVQCLVVGILAPLRSTSRLRNLSKELAN